MRFGRDGQELARSLFSMLRASQPSWIAPDEFLLWVVATGSAEGLSDAELGAWLRDVMAVAQTLEAERDQVDQGDRVEGGGQS